MIYDHISNIALYDGLNERIMKALRFIHETDFCTYNKARYELEENNIIVMVKEYDSNTINDTPEAHHDFIDIQYMISGQELISVGKTSSMKEMVKSDPEHDIWFYHGETYDIKLQEGQFMVLWPDDAHAPCIAVDGKVSKCKKCIVKIRL